MKSIQLMKAMKRASTQIYRSINPIFTSGVVLFASSYNLQQSHAESTKSTFALIDDGVPAGRPVSRFSIYGVRLEIPAQVSNTLWGVSSIPLGEAIEDDHTTAETVAYTPSRALNYQVRLGLNIDTRKLFSPIFFSAHYEQDFLTGFFSGGEAEVNGIAMPLSQNAQRNVIRKAFARLTLGPVLTVRGGIMTSHWGLGLLANDGNHGWTPGSAYFGDPRGGDRVQRILLATGPWTKDKLLLSVAYDKVLGDDVLLNDDTAHQMIFAAVYGYGKETQVGAYVVRRDQDIPQPSLGRNKKTSVWVYDVHAKSSWYLGDEAKLSAELEGVVIEGETTLAPNPEFSKNDVLQAALAAKINLSFGASGGVLDIIYATGDQNFDDGAQNAFRADPNYEMGLLLFRQVLSAQTGRSPITAGDLNLVGVPNEDLDRFPTRGSVSNTIAVFPKGWLRIYDGLELYGGPLFAWGETSLADPRNTRFNGGYPVNLLGGEGGRYLGTELDLGIRAQLGLWRGATLNLGAEGGAFFPGDAFKGEEPNDLTMGAVYGGRLMVRANF